MAKRDPAKTALNKKIDLMTAELEQLAPKVLEVLGHDSVVSLHGRIGGKNAEFIDIKNAVILSPEHYVTLWIEGFLEAIVHRRQFMTDDHYVALLRAVQTVPEVEQYVLTFLRRTYLRNHQALSRVRPTDQEAEVWLGHDRAMYGLLVTPRFVKGDWENDKSEIRHFPKNYFTIGHLLETGLVVPAAKDPMTFANVNDYLVFFEHSMVRGTGSPHEAQIAKRYVEHVRAAKDPQSVPLLLHEFRYGGRAKPHEHRLDFTIIDPFTLKKIGFELSPWSTHGYLKGTKGLTQKAINEAAQANFESEMKKLKDFFRKHAVYALIYTDEDLKNYDAIFGEMRKYLEPTTAPRQLELQAIDALHRFKV